MKLLFLSALVAFAVAAPRLAPPVPSVIFAEDGFIVGGQTASPNQFPFQAELLSSTSPNGTLTCGGVYIGGQWLLNAAHCTQSTMRSTWLGVHDRSDRNNAQFFTFTRIVNHPDYGIGSGAFPNDISLCKMVSTPDTSVPNIGAADLPRGDDDFAGATAIISGWGRTCGSCADSNKLQFARTTVLPNFGADSCETDWGNNVNDGHICVKSDNLSSGACSSDSGGPMSVGNTVIGITSWGGSGCPTTHPSVYSRVSYFRDWIRSVTGM